MAEKQSLNSHIHTCDWCEHAAVFMFPVTKNKRGGKAPTGINWYSCVKHKEQLMKFGDVVALN